MLLGKFYLDIIGSTYTNVYCYVSEYITPFKIKIDLNILFSFLLVNESFPLVKV